MEGLGLVGQKVNVMTGKGGKHKPPFAVVGRAMMEDRRFTLIQFRVLLAIKRHEKKPGDIVRVYRSTLAKITGYPERKITDTTTQLVQFGWLKKFGNGGRGQACRYRVSTQEEMERVPQTGTVYGSETVPNKGTVNVKTVPQMGLNGTQNEQKTVPDSGRGIEETIEETEETSSTASRFDDWWECYPRKSGKKKAGEIWIRGALDRIADTILADVKKRKDQDRKWRDGYIPNPTTYLDEERWNDEIELDPQVAGSASEPSEWTVPQGKLEELEERFGKPALRDALNLGGTFYSEESFNRFIGLQMQTGVLVERGLL